MCVCVSVSLDLCLCQCVIAECAVAACTLSTEADLPDGMAGIANQDWTIEQNWTLQKASLVGPAGQCMLLHKLFHELKLPDMTEPSAPEAEPAGVLQDAGSAPVLETPVKKPRMSMAAAAASGC